MFDRIKIEFSTEGSAFREEDFYLDTEVSRILKKIAKQIENGGRPEVILDVYGNRVGTIEYIKED